MRWTLILLALAGCTKDAAPWPAIGAEVPALAGVTQDGARFAWAPRPTLVFFGYTFCPDVCPLTLLTVKRAIEGLPEAQRDGVDVVFVTVDPERDTKERLAEYLVAFGRVRGVVPNDIEALKSAFAIAVEYEGETVNHTSVVFLLDREGRLAARFSHGAPPDEMRAGLSEVLP